MARPKKGRNQPPPPPSNPSPPSPPASDDGESGDSDLIFSYNNNVVFPTSDDRRNPFRIDLGERVYNLNEKFEERVLRVSGFSWDLEQYINQRSEAAIFRLHGGIKAISNITRELMKGIVTSFCTLIKETPDNDVMYLENPSNYLIRGLEAYRSLTGMTRDQLLIAGLDNSYCSPIQVIIVKDNKFGNSQRSLPEKVVALSRVLKSIYGEENYSCDRNEWFDFYNRLNALNIDGLERHHVFWHWTDKDGFIEYFDRLLNNEKVFNIVVGVFDPFHFFETDWETEFIKDPPMRKCYDTRLEPVAGTVGPTGGVGTVGSISGISAGSISGISGGGSSVLGLGQSARRRRGGVKFITKTRNCIAHMTNYMRVRNPNPTGPRYNVKYTHIEENKGEDDFKDIHYLHFRLLQKFPNLWNDLVPALRARGFNAY